VLILAAMIAFSCIRQTEEVNTKTFDTFIAGHSAKVEPLRREASLAYWEAATTGKEAVEED
jgi:hypothetical protein